MILLDSKADTFPCGLIGTPFEAVYKALCIVAADVWAVDPTVYRAGMAWGWYALNKPAELVGFRDVVAAALVSSFAPLVRDTQTDAELVEYLRQWRDYTPTFGRLQALYALFGATADVQPITDPESQAVLPVEDTRLAFYVRITEIDFSRPLSLDDAREIALRATPLGSRPYVYYALESRTQIPVAAIPQAPEVFVENWEIAQPAAPPVPLGDFILVDSLGNVVYSAENLTEIEFTPTGYFTIDEGNEVVFVEQSPFPVVCIDEGTRTPESIAPDASFDTELPYYASKLYIVTTDDGQGNVTRYGWEAGEEPAPSYGEDTATGSISAVTLPTEHSGAYVEAQFDSLRYYAKGTVSDKVYGTHETYFGTYSGWYIATITWSDSSIGDLSGDIVVSDPSGSTIQQQSVFYIVFITSGITGYAPNEYVVVGGYSYNNGTHSMRVYMTEGQGAWFDQQDAGRIQIRYLDGTTSFENLSAFDLVSVPSGTLSKDTATDRYAMYNAWGGNITVKAKYLE